MVKSCFLRSRKSGKPNSIMRPNYVFTYWWILVGHSLCTQFLRILCVCSRWASCQQLCVHSNQQFLLSPSDLKGREREVSFLRKALSRPPLDMYSTLQKIPPRGAATAATLIAATTAAVAAATPPTVNPPSSEIADSEAAVSQTKRGGVARRTCRERETKDKSQKWWCIDKSLIRVAK